MTPPPDASGENVASAAGRVSIATAASRVAGLGREVVFAALLGASWQASAFVVAFRIPNLLRDFFAEGALASAFVPTFAAVRARDGEARAFALARRVLGTLLAITGAIALLGILFAPEVVSVIAPDASDRMRDLTIHLTRIMFPFLPLVAVAAVLMGVLNTYRHYFVPAIAPAFFNLVAILGGLVLLFLRWDQPDRLPAAVGAWAVLVVLGGLVQVLIQVRPARRVGLRGWPAPDLSFRDPDLRTIVRRMAPVILSLAGTNLMLVIVTALATRDENWPSWLTYAFRLVHLPIGLIGVALGTVLLAAGSRRAAAGDAQGLDQLVLRGLRLNWFLALPAAVGLATLAEPIVRTIYQRGAFGAADTPAVAAALQGYAPGIVFYAGVKAAAPHFLARGNTRTPMICSLTGIAVTIGAALLTVGPWGHVGLALAVAAGSAVNYLLLRTLGRAAFGAASAPPGGFLLRVVLAAAAMGILGRLVVTGMFLGDGAVASPLLSALLTLVLIGLLALTYFVAAAALGIEEVSWLRQRLRRR